MKEIDKGSIDLVICDTFNHLTENPLSFSDKESRDQYIKKIQSEIKAVVPYLRDEERLVGSLLIGVNAFSISSLGKDIFGENAKRLIHWTREPSYENNTKIYKEVRSVFLWAFPRRGWVYHLKENEHFFDGEFLESKAEGKYTNSIDVITELLERFSDSQSNILELNPINSEIIKKTVQKNNRNYIAGKIMEGKLVIC